MLVVKTTSPATSPPPAKLQPSKAAPSSRTSVALLRTYSKSRSSPVVYRLAADHGVHDSTRQGSSPIRRVGRAADQGVPVCRPLLGEVDERKVRRLPDTETPPLPDPTSGRAAHSLDEAGERKPAVKKEIGVEGGEGRLVAQEPWRGLFHRQLLLLRGVRRVVGRHEIQDAVPQGRLDATAVAV